jgi:hypothetical protein
MTQVDIRCFRCGNTRFIEFTEPDNMFRHMRCAVCENEVTLPNTEARINPDD